MAWSHTQTKLGADGSATTATTVALSFNAAVSNNGLVVGTVFWGSDSITINGVADDNGNTYTVIDSANSGGDSASAAVFYKEGLTNGPTTITVTFSATTPYRRVVISEYAGILTSSSIDVHSEVFNFTPTTGANALASNSVTTTAAGDLVRGSFLDTSGNNNTYSAGTSPNAFTLRATGTGTDLVSIIAEDFSLASAGAIAATAGQTTADDWFGFVTTFKAAAGGPSLTASNLAAGAAGLGVPVFVAFTPIWVNTWVLDNGLTGLVNTANAIYICSAQPTTYTGATVTLALGSYTFGVGAVFGPPANGSPNGRVVTSPAISNGSITANGTAAWWAATDSVNSRLLATGPIGGGGAVVSGNSFNLTAVTVHLPSQ
jgi:hypothetical protein